MLVWHWSPADQHQFPPFMHNPGGVKDLVLLKVASACVGSILYIHKYICKRDVRAGGMYCLRCS